MPRNAGTVKRKYVSSSLKYVARRQSSVKEAVFKQYAQFLQQQQQQHKLTALKQQQQQEQQQQNATVCPDQNLAHITTILKHSCEWKGGNSPPSMEVVAKICEFKRLPSRGLPKFIMFKTLIQHLIKEIKNYKTTYVPPVPKTHDGKLLFKPEPTCEIVQRIMNARGPIEFPIVGTKIYKTIAAYKLSHRIGQPPLQASPCVPKNKINDHPVVYEEWQLHSKHGGRKNMTTYVCRRRRKPESARRKPDQRSIKEEYLGTQCPARHTATVRKDGSVLVIFRGTHNHDCQAKYSMKFINPLKVCQPLLEMVDRKLKSGVTKTAKVAEAVRKEAKDLQDKQKSFENIRLFELSQVLKRRQISYRFRHLGLHTPKKFGKSKAATKQNNAGLGKRKSTTPADNLPKTKLKITKSKETERKQPPCPTGLRSANA